MQLAYSTYHLRKCFPHGAGGGREGGRKKHSKIQNLHLKTDTLDGQKDITASSFEPDHTYYKNY